MLHVCVSIIRYNASDIKTNAHSNSQKEINESKKASGGQEKKKKKKKTKSNSMNGDYYSSKKIKETRKSETPTPANEIYTQKMFF